MPGKALPIAAIVVSTVSFFLRMNLRRLYLILGISSLIMVLPPMVFIVHAEGGLLRPLTTDLEYFAMSSLFLALWLFARWEREFLQSEKIDRERL